MGAVESQPDHSSDSDDELTPVTPEPASSRKRATLRSKIPKLDLVNIIKDTQEPVVVYNDPKAGTKTSSQKGCFDTLFCLEPEPSIEVSQIHNARRITHHVHNGSIKTAFQTKQTLFVAIDWQIATTEGRDSDQESINNIEATYSQIERVIKDMDGFIYGGNKTQTAEEMASSVPYDKILIAIKSIVGIAKKLGLGQLKETIANLSTIARAGNSRRNSNLVKSQYLRLCGEYTVLEKNLTAIKNEVERVKRDGR